VIPAMDKLIRPGPWSPDGSRITFSSERDGPWRGRRDPDPWIPHPAVSRASVELPEEVSGSGLPQTSRRMCVMSWTFTASRRRRRR
jgi:hypothetical protein